MTSPIAFFDVLNRAIFWILDGLLHGYELDSIKFNLHKVQITDTPAHLHSIPLYCIAKHPAVSIQDNTSTCQRLEMCIQNYRMYTCGCKRTEQFKQCEPRLGTNVKCSRLTWEPLGPSAHMCLQHMVKPGNKILRLKEDPDSENPSGQIDDQNSSANC